METRNNRGRFITRSDSLGKPIGLRVNKQLESVLKELAELEGVPVTVWCRQVVEAAILERQQKSTE